MQRKFSLLLIVLFLLSACAKQTTIRKHEAFDEKMLKTSTINVLPAEAVIKNVSASSSKRVDDYEYYMEGLINETLTSTLKKSGYKVSFISRKDIHDLKLSQNVAELQNCYSALIKELYIKPEWLEKKAFAINSTVGSKLANLNNDSEKKYLVFATYEGYHKTNGLRIASFMFGRLIGGYSDSDSENLIIGIVDSSTGNIVWSNSASFASDATYTALRKIANSDKQIAQKDINFLVRNALKPILK